MFRPLALLIAIVALAACQPSPEPEVRRAEAIEAPLGVAAGAACWASDRIPAVTDTVFEPVGTGAEQRAREVIVQPAEQRLFAVPCPDQMTGELIASLQRALAARGLHAGVVSGALDGATVEAVRRFQAPLGLNSGVLSLQAAQQLGLIAVARPAL